MNKIKSIHFVGIKGVGMAPLALIAKQAGVIVTGSDIADTFITDSSLQKAGITPFVGFDSSHVGSVDLVITTGAHQGYDNIEVKTAKENDIPVVTQGEAVGIFMRGEIFGKLQKGISIFGSHGKTTTTAMIATILDKAELDPSYLIGTSNIPSLGESGHFGKGDYFVAEADEYMTEPTYDKTPKLLWQHPKIAVCTNIELDHPDVYPNVEALINVFRTFIQDLPDEGILIANGDDSNIEKLLQQYHGNKKTFGYKKENDYQIVDIQTEPEKTSFGLIYKGENIGNFSLNVIGDHNVFNATAAIITALSIDIPIDKIRAGIGLFTGSKRRLEFIKNLTSGAALYDDYGHHPTEIAASLLALKKSHSDKKVVCIFQPHTYSRTKVLFTEFTKAFEAADEVVLTAVYASAREKTDSTVSMDNLARQINLNGQKTVYLPKPIDVIKYILSSSFGKETIIVTMGAGDIYKISSELS